MRSCARQDTINNHVVARRSLAWVALTPLSRLWQCVHFSPLHPFTYNIGTASKRLTWLTSRNGSLPDVIPTSALESLNFAPNCNNSLTSTSLISDNSSPSTTSLPSCDLKNDGFR